VIHIRTSVSTGPVTAAMKMPSTLMPAMPPIIARVMNQNAMMVSTLVTITACHSAPMILPPGLTRASTRPITEARIDTPPSTSG